MPANPGVNPSLTITAISEHAMTAVPEKGAEGEFQIESQPFTATSAPTTVVTES
jgi:cholesterol oxidase